MVKHTCYCDRCNTEFENGYCRAFKVSNSHSLSDPSNIISGDDILNMILCPECEEDLLRWLGKEEYIEKIQPHPRSYRLRGGLFGWQE